MHQTGELKRAFVGALLLSVACAAQRTYGEREPTDCWSLPPKAAAAFDPGDLERLTGGFNLILVVAPDATDSSDLFVVRSRLRLSPPDSSQRAALSTHRIGYVPRKNLQLVGHEEVLSGRASMEPAEVDGGVLYLGCRDCNDASPHVLRIQRTSARGFWGTWRNFQTGIVVIIDARTGKPAGDPEGYFCAVRNGE